MKKKNTYWDKIYEQPLNKIPWQNTQTDWLNELMENHKIKGFSALDLGCGTGKKSIYLAKHGFSKIIGIDIAERAIEIAKQNAQQENVANLCTFICDDATTLSSIKDDETFDFILDWANIHGISSDKIPSYISNINKHSHKDTLLLIRTFSIDSDEKYFKKEMDGAKTTLSMFSKQEIIDLFPWFKILETNKSKPQNQGPKPGIFFLELLLKKS